jgi:N-acetylglutamate synthase-like GNAT family acetyltransferase
MEIRALRRNEIEKVRGITRNEVVEQVYYFVDGSLVLRDEFHDMKGWNASELDRCVSRIYDIYDRNGILLGAFVKNRLVGVSVLDSEFIGKDKLQLYFHHVDNNYRHRGVGGKLFRNIVIEAKELGAKSLYVSATPSKNTIGFYLHMGCRLASEVHTKLFELESKDIHLDFLL